MDARCLFCGGVIGANGACEVCGTVRAAVDEKRIGAPCPRCAIAHLGAVEIGPVVVQGCALCRGVFVAASEWDAILEMTARAPLPRQVPLVSAAPVPAAIESADMHPYRGEISAAVGERIGEIAPDVDLASPVRCPVCSTVAERVEFAFISRIVVDVCKLHGIWLDGGELARVVDRAKEDPTRPEIEWRPSEVEMEAYELVGRSRSKEKTLLELVLRAIGRKLWRRPN